MAAVAPNPTELRRRAETLAAGYPGLLAEAERVAAVVAQGVHGRRRPGQGETFWQYRNYHPTDCLLYTSPSPRDKRQSRMPSSA